MSEEDVPAESGDGGRNREPRFLFIEAWWWEALGGFISVLGVLAALFGVFEYKQRVEAAKASETLALIDIWETRGARDAYDRLAEDIARLFSEVPAADMQAAAEDEKIARLISDKVVGRVLRDDASSEAFEDVVYFFNRLGLCVEANLCSQHTAAIFFEDTLGTFLDVFANQLELLRETRPRYGEAMLTLHEDIKED